MDPQSFILLGIKVKPGPIERHKLENFTLDNTVDSLKLEAEKKSNVPSASLELIHHGKILKDNTTLSDNGIKIGEMVHVLKKKVKPAPKPPQTYSDAELQQLNSSLRSLGCTPTAPGWSRAMQLLNDDSAMAEIIDHAPSLGEDCTTLSILHEVELLAALGANVQTMRRGAEAHPDLPNALRQLLRLVRSRSNNTSSDNTPVSGFAYSLEALSEDEDVEEEEPEERTEPRPAITEEQVAVALQIATDAVMSRRPAGRRARASPAPGGSNTGGTRAMITSEMFNEAITEAMNRSTNPAGTPMDQSNAASSSQSPESGHEEFGAQLTRMHEIGLLDDALNLRALLICQGDVNAAINLVFSGAIQDE